MDRADADSALLAAMSARREDLAAALAHSATSTALPMLTDGALQPLLAEVLLEASMAHRIDASRLPSHRLGPARDAAVALRREGAGWLHVLAAADAMTPTLTTTIHQLAPDPGSAARYLQRSARYAAQLLHATGRHLHALRVEADPASTAPISVDDRELLTALADGMCTRTAAKRLGVAPQTIRYRQSRLAERLGAANRTHLISRAFRLGLL